MIEIHWLAGNPELLGGIQTFVGVMVTLTVLCIFNDDEESNFLRKITISLWDDLSKGNSSYIECLKKAISDDNSGNDEVRKKLDKPLAWSNIASGANKSELLKNRAKASQLPNEFFNKAQQTIIEGKAVVEALKMRQEDAYIQLYILVVTIFVMVVDCVHLAEKIGSFFLICMSVMITLFGTGMWINYINRNKPSKMLDSSNHRSWTRWLGTVLLVACLYTCFMLMLCIGSIISFITSCLIGLGIIYAYTRYRWKNIIIERYNNRFVLKHAFYSIVVVVGLTVVMYYSCTMTFLYSAFAEEYGIYFLHWNMRIDWLLNPQMARSIFAMVVSLYGIFIPITVGFGVSHYQARKVKADIRSTFEEMQDNANKLQSEYWNIVAKIINNNGVTNKTPKQQKPNRRKKRK